MADGKSVRYYVTIILAAIALFVHSVGFASEADQKVTLRVVKGDCLINICRIYLNNESKWREVARINQLKNPDLIYPNQRITVPAGFLKHLPLDMTVSYVRGDVQKIDKNEKGWTLVHRGQRLRQGASVKTGSDSGTVLAFDDGATYTLEAMTHIGLTVAQRWRDGNTVRQISLSLGEVRSDVPPLKSPASHFEIKTPSAVAGVRGTSFSVRVADDKSMTTQVYKGSVYVKNKGAEELLKEGQGVVVRHEEEAFVGRRLLAPPAVSATKSVFDVPLVIRFEPVAGARLYRVRLCTDKQGLEVVASGEVAPDEPFRVNELADGEYYLTVQSVDADGLAGTLSVPLKITVGRRVAAPLITAPGENAETRDPLVQVQWNSVTGAQGYRIELARDPGFSEIVEQRNIAGANQYATSPLKTGTYYVRLAALGIEKNVSDWSPPRSFRVIVPIDKELPPAAVPLVPPLISKLRESKREVALSWDPVPGAKSYLVQVSADQSFTQVVIEEKTKKPAVTVSVHRPADYYIRICAVDYDGKAGQFSSPRKFTVRQGIALETMGPSVSLGLIVLLALLL